MKEVSYWLADDGTRFEEERECFEYEFKQKAQTLVGKELKLFNDKREEITDYDFNSIYDAFAVQVLTIEGARFLVDWAYDYGVESPFSHWDIGNQDEDLLGAWVYDAFDRGGWTHLDKFKREIDELYFALQ